MGGFFFLTTVAHPPHEPDKSTWTAYTRPLALAGILQAVELTGRGKESNKKKKKPRLLSTFMFKQGLMQSLLAFAVLLQPVCLLPPRVAGSGCTGFHFFSFPLVFKQQRGVSASAGQPDELPEGIKLEKKIGLTAIVCSS